MVKKKETIALNYHQASRKTCVEGYGSVRVFIFVTCYIILGDKSLVKEESHSPP
jgi:hypothetical protein